MATTKKYAIISNLEAAKPVHKLDDLPLHVTLVGIFSSSKKPEYFKPFLDTISHNLNAVSVKTIGREDFGDQQKSTMVTTLEKTKELASLHQKLIALLRDDIKTMNPNFLPETYRPHVTDQNRKRVPQESQVAINNLTLVEIKDNDVFERYRIELL